MTKSEDYYNLEKVGSIIDTKLGHLKISNKMANNIINSCSETKKHKFNFSSNAAFITIILILFIGTTLTASLLSKNNKIPGTEGIASNGAIPYNTDGQDSVTKSSDDIRYFHIVKSGEWTYYTNDGLSLYKTNSDGSQVEKIYGVQQNNDIMYEIISYFYVEKDYIYLLTDVSESEGIWGNIYRIKTDGSETIVLSFNECANMRVSGDWVYYTNINDGNKFYRVKTDGSIKQKISDKSGYDMNIYDGKIYFHNYSMNLDGTDLKELSTDGMAYTQVADGWIYYLTNLRKEIDAQDECGNVYRMKTDGTNKQKLSSESVYNIYLYKDWIIYNSGGLNRMKIDGTDKQNITDNAMVYTIEDGWIYYKNDDDGSSVYRIKIDGSGKEKITRKTKLYETALPTPTNNINLNTPAADEKPAPTSDENPVPTSVAVNEQNEITPLKLVELYYTSISNLDYNTAVSCLSDEFAKINFPNSKIENIKKLTNFSIHGEPIKDESNYGFYANYCEKYVIAVEYDIEYINTSATAQNGKQIRFVEVAKIKEDSPWKIISIGTGP